MNIILLIAAIVISFVVLTWLIRVVKTTLKTALIIAAIVFGLQLLFGVGPSQVWQQVSQIPQFLWNLVSSR
jgi:heme A synthase